MRPDHTTVVNNGCCVVAWVNSGKVAGNLQWLILITETPPIKPDGNTSRAANDKIKATPTRQSTPMGEKDWLESTAQTCK